MPIKPLFFNLKTKACRQKNEKSHNPTSLSQTDSFFLGNVSFNLIIKNTRHTKQRTKFLDIKLKPIDRKLTTLLSKEKISKPKKYYTFKCSISQLTTPG